MDVDVEFYRENLVYRSWADHNLSFAVESPANGFAGFRKPQRAAAFAIFSHLDSDPEVAGDSCHAHRHRKNRHHLCNRHCGSV